MLHNLIICFHVVPLLCFKSLIFCYRYAESAVERLGIQIPLSELDNSETKSQLNQWLQVVAFYSLRLLLAPSIESVLLLDRMLFLHEAGRQIDNIKYQY